MSQPTSTPGTGEQFGDGRAFTCGRDRRVKVLRLARRPRWAHVSISGYTWVQIEDGRRGIVPTQAITLDTPPAPGPPCGCGCGVAGCRCQIGERDTAGRLVCRCP